MSTAEEKPRERRVMITMIVTVQEMTEAEIKAINGDDYLVAGGHYFLEADLEDAASELDEAEPHEIGHSIVGNLPLEEVFAGSSLWLKATEAEHLSSGWVP